MRDSEKDKKKPLKDKVPPPLPNYVVGTTPQRAAGEDQRELTVKEMMENFRRLQDQFERKLDEVFQMTGWTPEFISSYLSNPNNFKEADWKWLNEERQALIEKYQPSMEGFGLPRSEVEKYAKKSDQALLHSTSSPLVPGGQIVAKGDKELRSKTAGTRRKWIPMR